MRKVRLAAALLAAVAIYLVFAKSFSVKTIDQVRVGVGLHESVVAKIDPAQVQSANQALLVTNLFSKLVEYDKFGQLQAGISTKFYWEGHSLVLEFGNKVKTQSGHFIDAQDAAVSIRRLIKLDSNIHVNLKLLLCDIKTVKDVFTNCDGVKVQDKKLILTPKNLKFKHFLLKALTASDFAIVPEQQIDKTTLDILSLRETSGAYYLESRDDKQWVLKANAHYRINETTPKEVILVNLAPNDIWNAFVENKIDVVTTISPVDADVLQQIKSVPDVAIAETMDLKLYFIKFSPKALRDFTAEQRLYLGERFRSVMKEKYTLPISSKETHQIFSDVGYGHLSQEQEAKISSLRANAKTGVFERKPQFYFYRSVANKYAPFKEILEIDPVLTDQRPYMQKPEERLDMFFGATDSAYEESLALIGSNFTQGTFGTNETEASEWMKKYIDTEDESKRLAMLQDLHFKALENGVTVPLFKAPYTAVARNHFKVNQSKLFASTAFWNIIKE
ncbi:hypothetical protein [Pseudobdellovibrio sp. HCB154]|uniref:hypothetical protein n=1 Tax=Pseudobdellovibrio sp. HCB154 TaxID=3386277 RepID=UPI003916CFD3